MRRRAQESKRHSNMVLAAGVLYAIAGTAAPQSELTSVSPIMVCIEKGPKVEGDEVERAEITAQKMFAWIGLRIVWRNQGPTCPAAGDSILVKIANGTPDSYRPRAYGVALPYEGIHMWVFYDRVHHVRPDLVVPVLAHVLVHEIVHLLTGTDSHSDTGVMKFRWTQSDMEQMLIQPLRFSDFDISLLKVGVRDRHMRVVAARTRTMTPTPARIDSDAAVRSEVADSK
jgi:hypothetical protein